MLYMAEYCPVCFTTELDDTDNASVQEHHCCHECYSDLIRVLNQLKKIVKVEDNKKN